MSLSIPGHEGFLFRYRRHDDFGRPQSAFGCCSFWWAEAEAELGRVHRSAELVQIGMEAGNHLGLFSEHFDPAAKVQLGNFPQTYSHAGLIQAVVAIDAQTKPEAVNKG
jgi:GH15 family glucan-1,4-alpha-glucosidase